MDCLVVCVSICHLSTVDFRQSGIIRRRKTTCQRGISRRKYHVLYRYRSGIFSCISVNVAFLAEYQVSEMVPNQISLDSYMSNFLTLNFIMGLVFELPLLCWLLSNMGLITRRFFKTYRRHAIVILLILAAFITPSSDPFTLSVVFVPLYALYELSAWVVKPASQKDDGNSEEDSNEILDEH